MSNRTLFEFNHDLDHEIDRDPYGFCMALSQYLRSGDKQTAEELKQWGLTYHGMRHHSDKPWSETIAENK